MIVVVVLKEEDKYVVYFDGETAYMCDKEKFYKNYKKSL